jgi:hypothetical protein
MNTGKTVIRLPEAGNAYAIRITTLYGQKFGKISAY